MITDYAKSVRANLLNISRREGISFQAIVTRYIHERFLWRLSHSRYRENFCLKGGALIYGIQRLSARPTLDIDLLGIDIKNDISLMHKVFDEIFAKEYDDTILSLPESMHIRELMENRRYLGLRITVDVHLDTMKEKLSVDIGFGYVITPSYKRMDYPTLLEAGDRIAINAYSIETVIAEKFEAMISLSLSNSRMKDFFDVFNFLENNQYDANILETALLATLRNRGITYIERHPLFSDVFAKDTTRRKMWKVSTENQISKRNRL